MDSRDSKGLTETPLRLQNAQRTNIDLYGLEVKLTWTYIDWKGTHWEMGLKESSQKGSKDSHVVKRAHWDSQELKET